MKRFVFLVNLLLASTLTITAAHAAGGIFTLGGSARHAEDPTNEDNEVVSIDTGNALAPQFGFVRRTLNVKVPTLDDQLSVNYYFLSPMSCFGGSPRYQLAIDTDGDGVSNGNAFGYLGPSPSFAGCPMGVWQFEDLTDVELEWDITQFGGPFYNTWDGVEIFFTTLHPNHLVLRGSLVADSFAPPMFGCSFYDNIEIGDMTWRSSADTTTVQGTQPNGCPLEADDDDLDDDGERDDEDRDDDNDGRHDEEDDDDDNDGENDDADSDDDNDGIEDSFDSESANEVQQTNADAVEGGQEKTYDLSTGANSLLLIATAEAIGATDPLNQALTVEIYDPRGVLVAKSPAVAGRVVATAVPVLSGTYKVKVRNGGSAKIQYRTLRITRTTWALS